jgi:TadE-like protein
MLRRKGMSMVLAKALGAFFGRERLAVAGVAAIELAMVAPLVVTGVLGAGELGFTIFRQTQVIFAAQAGVDYAIANGFNSTNVSNAVVNATTYTAITATPAPSQFCGCPTATGVTVASAVASKSPLCSATCSGGFTAGVYVQANSQAQFSPIIPNPWQKSTVTLTAESTVRIQ